MKRVLSWLVLIIGYIAVCVVMGPIAAVIANIAQVNAQLLVFKIVAIIIRVFIILMFGILILGGGSYIPFVISDKICPSRRGHRYFIIGILIIASCALEIIVSGFQLKDILIGICGIMITLFGF